VLFVGVDWALASICFIVGFLFSFFGNFLVDFIAVRVFWA
jgi:hypothetical protein